MPDRRAVGQHAFAVKNCALLMERGKPPSAYSMAGWKTVARSIVPYISRAVSQPPSAPGVSAERMPTSAFPKQLSPRVRGL